MWPAISGAAKVVGAGVRRVSSAAASRASTASKNAVGDQLRKRFNRSPDSPTLPEPPDFVRNLTTQQAPPRQTNIPSVGNLNPFARLGKFIVSKFSKRAASLKIAGRQILFTYLGIATILILCIAFFIMELSSTAQNDPFYTIRICGFNAINAPGVCAADLAENSLNEKADSLKPYTDTLEYQQGLSKQP